MVSGTHWKASPVKNSISCHGKRHQNDDAWTSFCLTYPRIKSPRHCIIVLNCSTWHYEKNKISWSKESRYICERRFSLHTCIRTRKPTMISGLIVQINYSATIRGDRNNETCCSCLHVHLMATSVFSFLPEAVTLNGHRFLTSHTFPDSHSSIHLTKAFWNFLWTLKYIPLKNCTASKMPLKMQFVSKIVRQ